MAPLAEQVEKQTIFARLSVSIYKMTDDQLAIFLESLGEDADVAAIDLPQPKADGNANMKRQMIIARIFVLINQMDKDTLLGKLQTINHPDFRWTREYPRLSCYLVVDFAAGDKVYRSCIRDISANGLFIETSNSFEDGQELALCFTMEESDETLPFKVKGRVTRIYPDGIGVEYENMTHYQRDILNVLIDKYK